MELNILEPLEQQITRLLDTYRVVKRERDELFGRVSRLESENNELRIANETLSASSDEALRNARDPEWEERLRIKVDELLAKLEGF